MQAISCYGKQFGKWEPAPRNCSLIPGLPNELALVVLAFVPRVHHGGLRSVCRAWRDALHSQASQEVSSIRKRFGISEEWVILLSDSYTLVFFDPVLERFSKPILLHKPRVGSFVNVLGTSSNLFVVHETADCESFRYFNTSTMLWYGKSYYLPQIFRKDNDAWVVVDNHIYAVGGENLYRDALNRVDRFDITKQIYDALPNMHRGRAGAAVVQLQGRLCVLGGEDFRARMRIYSGEIWDAETREWILEPELWPQQLFYSVEPVAATLKGTLYAIGLMSREILQYHPTSKLWISCGAIPVAYFVCRDCTRCKKGARKNLIEVLNELWIKWQCGCQFRVLAGMQNPSTGLFSWRVVPITEKFTALSTVSV